MIPSYLRTIGLFILGGLLLLTIPTRSTSGLLEIHGLSIGQGDSILIRSAEGRTILVDGGAGNDLLMELPKALGHNNQYIDILIITHLDFDHIGGLLDIIPRYRIGSIIMPDQKPSSEASKKLFELITYHNIPIIHPDPHKDIQIDQYTVLDILFPWEDIIDLEGLSSNNGSLVAQLRYGNTRVLLTGDLEKEGEELLLRTGTMLNSTVLKVGHHGSNTSTSPAFLSAVQPTYVLLNYGIDNKYGHPHQEVVNQFTDKIIFDTSKKTVHIFCTQEHYCESSGT